MGEAYAVDAYKKRFGIDRVRCLESELKRRRSYIAFLEREGKHWTKERVCREIRRRRSRGLPINHGALGKSPSGSGLRAAGIALFKTWDRALAAAGFDPWKIHLAHRWTEDRMIRELRRNSTGKVYIPANIPIKRHRALYAAARELFGSWPKAVHAAGLKTKNPPRREWTRRDILERIAQRVREGSGVAAADVLEKEPGLYWALKRLSGLPWTRAIQSLGLRGRVVLWDKELLKAELRNWHRSGKTRLPGVSFMALRLAAEDWFGSWWKALAAAGVRPRTRPPVHWTRAEVIKRLRRRRREGKSMSWKVVFTHEKGLYQATRRFLGKPWTAVMRERGWDGGAKRVIWTDELLLEEVRRFQRGRRSPNSTPKNLRQAARRRFGSWANALRRAHEKRRATPTTTTSSP